MINYCFYEEKKTDVVTNVLSQWLVIFNEEGDLCPVINLKDRQWIKTIVRALYETIRLRLMSVDWENIITLTIS